MKSGRERNGITDEQFEKLVTQLEERLSQKLWDEVALKVGKGVLSKGLYLLGATLAAIAAWLHGAGYLKIPGATE